MDIDRCLVGGAMLRSQFPPRPARPYSFQKDFHSLINCTRFTRGRTRCFFFAPCVRGRPARARKEDAKQSIHYSDSSKSLGSKRGGKDKSGRCKSCHSSSGGIIITRPTGVSCPGRVGLSGPAPDFPLDGESHPRDLRARRLRICSPIRRFDSA